MKTTILKSTFLLIGSLILYSSSLIAGDIVPLVQMCESCHGKDGNSIQPDVPIIAGFSYEGFLNTMDVFRLDERIALSFQVPGESETIMNDIARSLGDEDVIALSEYFSQRPFMAAKQQADETLAARGEILHKQKCERCHKQNGAEPVMDAAILAGQWTPYLRRQFENIKSGKRLIPKSMLRRVRNLPGEDIEALLNFYALEGSKLAETPES